MARQNGKDKGIVENPPGSGVWWVDCYLNGQRFRKKVGAKTAAREFYQKIKTEQRESRLFPEKYRHSHGKFDELAEDVLNDYKANGKRSLARAEQNIETLREFFGNCRMADITTDRVKAYIAYRSQNRKYGEEGKRISNATINRELRILKRVFNLGAKSTPPKIERVPHIPLLEENNIRSGFFEHDEFLCLRGALPDHARVPVTIAYYTGMRQGEILGLRWDQVDLKEGKIYLSSAQTKNKTPRMIPLYGELYEVLLNAYQARLEKYPGCPWVCHLNGKRLQSIKVAWNAAVKRIGLEGRLFHDFRRTGVRNMVRAGIPEKVAMAISGHKTRSVFDRYNIVSEADLKAAAEKMVTYHAKKDSGIENGTDTKTDTSRIIERGKVL